MIAGLPDECYAVLLVNCDGLMVSIAAALRVFVRSRSDTALEVLALRQQLAVLKRKRREYWAAGGQARQPAGNGHWLTKRNWRILS